MNNLFLGDMKNPLFSKTRNSAKFETRNVFCIVKVEKTL
jgi:hypothetical protein